MTRQFTSPDEQKVYDTYFEYEYFGLAHRHQVPSNAPHRNREATILANQAADAIMDAQLQNISAEHIAAIRAQALFDAVEQLSREGAPFKVRHLIVRPEAITVGEGDAQIEQVAGLSSAPLFIAEQQLLVYVYHDPSIDPKQAQQYAREQAAEGNLG